MQTHFMAIHEAWMFEDDSVLVKFDNGCRLQLSSCAAVFRCLPPTDKVNSGSEQRNKETQQCSQFATTTWKGMVKQAVDFRNKFACYPYLCSSLSETVTTAEQHRIVNSTSCTWFAEDPGKNINHSHDGSISITSKENNATVMLSACKQSFNVNFLCKIQNEKQSESKRPAYTWVRQIHSTNLLYPYCFYYPMNLLNAGTMVEENVELTSSVVSELPQSLPQQCRKHHLHRWRSNWNAEEYGACEFLDRELIKVYYSENVFYRFYYEKYLIGEVSLPDGSVLRSTGSTHLYFKHWVYDPKSESVHENVYSVRAPPLNDRTSSIAKVLNTVCRYLKYLNVYWKRQTMSLDCCWKNCSDSEPVDEKTELEFSTYIRDHGSFGTFSNGKVRIAFCDGAIMEFYEPNERELPHRDNENCYVRSSGKQLTDLVVDSFNLILPNGISLKASFDSPSRPYIRYIKIALDFIKWKKNYVGKEQQLDDENSNLVYEELKKLRRFTDTATLALSKNNKEDIVHSVDTQDKYSAGLKPEAKNVSNTSPSEARVPPLSEIRNMEEYLNSTRRTVDEIDIILQNCKSQLKKR